MLKPRKLESSKGDEYISLELFEDLAVQRLRVGVRHNISGSNKI